MRLFRSLMLILLMILPQSCAWATPYGSNTLRANIAFTNQQLIIDNMDPFVWNEVVITLDRNYTYEIDVLPRGKSSFPYTDFADSAHHKYKPGLLKARSVEIDVEQGLDSGSGHFEW